jgi:hypothetical protein
MGKGLSPLQRFILKEAHIYKSQMLISLSIGMVLPRFFSVQLNLIGSE